MKNKRYKQAIEYFEALDTLYPFNPETRIAQRDIIKAYFQQLGGKRPRLFPQFYRGARSQSALATQGEHSHTPLEYPHALLSRGQAPEISFVKKGDRASAIAAADRYLRLYPRGPDADYAYYMKGTAEISHKYHGIRALLKVERRGS